MSIGSRGRLLVTAWVVAGALLALAACSSSQPPAAVTPDEVEPGAAPAAAATSSPAGEESAGEAPPSDADEDAEGPVPGELPVEPLVPEPAEEAMVDEAPPVDSAALLQESLEAYESGQVFWEQGNFDDALAALDRAYELMLAVPPDGDPLIAQEKENLRHLISRRVVEIYASRRTVVGDVDRSIPVVVNDHVRREIESFQGPEREFFVDSYRRSGLYRPLILQELRRTGLPEQLSWMPLVESGFKVRAYSRARALGLWQFIASTGYRYDLERTWWIDERMDPTKATRAAIAYLLDLHDLFGDWLTALAAYNCGERTVLRRINSQRMSYFDQFWDLYLELPRETRRYVPRFLAVLEILRDPGAYGFELPEPLPTGVWETVEIGRATRLETLEEALELETGTLQELNPELRRGATPDEPYELKVPPGKGEILLAALETLPEWQPPSVAYTVHRVRRGETLSGVAARYRTTVGELMELNRLRSAHRIWPGQQLRVPDRRPVAVAQPGGGGAELRHRVQRGDSLWRIAHRYGTTVEHLKRDNGLQGNLLHPGQVLLIRPGASTSGATYVVRRGDTLGRIARTHGVSLNRLLAANGLSRRTTIYPGQRIWIPE